MTTSVPIAVSRDGAIATVTLNRPEKLNALTKTMWEQLGEAISALSADDTLRCVIVLTTVPIYAAVLRVPFDAIAPMIVVSCAIGAYAIQNAMFDVWLMLLFGVVGYIFKKIGIPLAPFTLALVLGNRTEDAFRLSMIGAGGDMRVFWSNGLVGSITTLALILLFWPLIGRILERVGRLRRPAAT